MDDDGCRSGACAGDFGGRGKTPRVGALGQREVGADLAPGRRVGQRRSRFESRGGGVEG